MTIPSPYNFVPLSKEVFFPDWAESVSMDVPFRDGISGTLDIEATAETPVFIRNANDKKDTDFYRLTKDGNYAIPGTSMKGMLRNVFEIITFSKIAGTSDKTSLVSEHRYAIRDLHNNVYTNKMSNKSIAGWLSQDEDGGWSVTPCKCAMVEQEELEKKFRLPDMALGKGGMHAKDKYDRIDSNTPYTTVRFTCEDFHGKQIVRSLIEKGDKEGIVVFTGQPSDRKRNAKHTEFIFYDESPAQKKDITVQVKDDFKFIHSILGENRKPNTEWEFWSKKLEKGGRVPVFFLREADGKITAMGLAMMFRLAYENTVLDAVFHTSQDHVNEAKADMAELLFGHASKDSSLKGRVCIEPLTQISPAAPLPKESEIYTVLGTPRPTYYPNYLKQPLIKKTGVYKTFMDSDCEIRGWKRYLARKELSKLTEPPTDDVATRFKPLAKGVKFAGRIHLHNVKPEELGALLWAITLGKLRKDSGLRHMIGMAKPYGYGLIALTVTGENLDYCAGTGETVDLSDCVERFKTMIKNSVVKDPKKEFNDIEQIKWLRAMSNPKQEWPQISANAPVYPVIGTAKKYGSFAFYTSKEVRDVLDADLPLEPKKPQGNNNKVAQQVTSVKLTNVERLLKELDGSKMQLGRNEIVKLLKEYKVSAADCSDTDRAKVLSSLKRRSGKNASSTVQVILKEWE